MAVAIRLTRVGATKRPAYRVIAIDKRRSRDGRALEILGYYDPLTEPATVKLETDRIKAWIGKGAQPSDMVVRLMAQAEATAKAGTDAPAPKRATRAAGAKPSKKAAAKVKAAEGAAAAPAEETPSEAASEDAAAAAEPTRVEASAAEAAPVEGTTEEAPADESAVEAASPPTEDSAREPSSPDDPVTEEVAAETAQDESGADGEADKA